MGRSSTLGQLLNKLAAISPMPSDEALLADEGDVADRYDTLIEEISHHLSANTPDAAEEAEVFRVLADSFGLGGGMGVYWGTLHLIERCTPSIALAIIQDRTIYGQPGSRRWCCFILGRRRNIDNLPLFLALLNDSQSEVLAQALQSLVMLAQAADLKDVRPSVSPFLEHPDAEVRKAAQRAVETIGVRHPAPTLCSCAPTVCYYPLLGSPGFFKRRGHQ
jgi:hypothetical protein